MSNQSLRILFARDPRCFQTDRRKKLAANSANDEGVYLITRTDNQTCFDNAGGEHLSTFSRFL